MLLMVLFVSNAAYSQIINKDGFQLKINNEKLTIEQLNNQSLSNAELVGVYKYLVELQKVRSDYLIENKKVDVLNKQVNAYQNQLALKDDMNQNLQAYAEQVKARWWQSEYAIIAWVTGSIVLTYLVTK